jgi:hypothetical protein
MTLRLRLSTGRPRRVGSVLCTAMLCVGLIAVVALASGTNTARPRLRFVLPHVPPVAVVLPVVLPSSVPEPTDQPPPIAGVRLPEAVIDMRPASHPAPSPRPTSTDSGLAAEEKPLKAAEEQPLKAVVIVGPTGGETATNLERGEEFALRAEAHGMDVRRVFYPNATWKNVLANVQGANLVAYFGHGNGWPSPYGSFQEGTKNGLGLDGHDGGTESETTYYGANLIRQNIKLAPNAVVVLSHLCYSAGNAEPGMPLPTEDVAVQRVDNYASAFLSVGARTVFAYGTGSATAIVDGLFARDRTMDDIFMTRGRKKQPYYGFVGWQDRYFDSARMLGFRSHLDPGQTEGYLRAISGDLQMTTTQWATGNAASSTPQR